MKISDLTKSEIMFSVLTLWRQAKKHVEIET